MSTTLKKVTRLLNDQGWRVHTSSDGTAAIIAQSGDRAQPIMFELYEEGRLVRLLVPWFMALPEGDKREALLAKLMQRNNLLKLVKFGLNPDTGEVTAEIELPVLGAKLRKGQLKRAIWILAQSLPEHREALQKFLETGVDPRDEQENMDNTVRRLLEAEPGDEDGDELGEDDDTSDMPALPDMLIDE